MTRAVPLGLFTSTDKQTTPNRYSSKCLQRRKSTTISGRGKGRKRRSAEESASKTCRHVMAPKAPGEQGGDVAPVDIILIPSSGIPINFPVNKVSRLPMPTDQNALINQSNIEHLPTAPGDNAHTTQISSDSIGFFTPRTF